MKWILIVFSTLGLFSCTNHNHQAHWDYGDKSGPSHWAELSADFIQCVEGHQQSPVNIDPATCKTLKEKGALHFHYVPSVLDVVNNGHTEQVNCLTDDEIEIEGKSYRLNQFHFHAPSEHTLKGEYFPLEVHFVHLSDDQEIAVIGILVREAAHNPAFDPILAHLPDKEGQHDIVPVPVNPLQLLPDNLSTYHYQGSLTTPPCSEGVSWYVMEHPVELSSAQIKKFIRHFPHNNRPVQPIYDREIFAE